MHYPHTQPMATADELACATTITETLSQSLEKAASSLMTRVSEQEAADLLDLLPQVFTADTHPARTHALLFQVHPAPFAVCAGFLHRSLSLPPRLQVCAMRAVAAIVSTTLSPDTVAHLGARVRDAIVAAHIIDALLDFAESADPHLVANAGGGGGGRSVNGPTIFPEAIAAMEVLFVFAMKLPQLSTYLVHECGVVPRLLNIIVAHAEIPRLGQNDAYDDNGPTAASAATTSPKGLIDYACATLRVVAEEQPSAFTSRDAAPLFSALTLVGSKGDPKLRNALLLIFEMVNKVLSLFPSCFIAHVVSNAALWADTAAVCLAHATIEGDAAEVYAAIVSAAQEASSLILQIEATLSPSVANPASMASGLRHGFNAPQIWQRALVAASRDVKYLGMLRLQRELVQSAVSHDQVTALQDTVMGAFPSICLLLTPGKVSHRDALVEAALIVALACAKLPAVRYAIGDMVKGYEPWALNLLGTAEHALGRLPRRWMCALPLIDTHHCWLNDPLQLSVSGPFSAAKVAYAVYLEQERRAAAGSPLSALRVDPLSLLQEAHRVQTAGSHAPPSQLFDNALVEQQLYELTVALLSTALGLSFTNAVIRQKFNGANRYSTVTLGGTPPPMSQMSGQESAAVDESTPVGRLQRGTMAPVPTGFSNSQQRARSPGASNRSAIRAANNLFGVSPQPHQVQVLRALGETPQPRPAFRPSSPGASTGGATPLARAAVASAKGRALSPASSRKPSIVDQVVAASTPTGSTTSRQDVAALAAGGVPGSGASEYLSMALMLHLAITFGVHYNRRAKGAIRTILGPKGPFVQPVHRNVTHSWSASDVRSDDLYVLFVPFHKLSVARMEAEIATVERYLLDAKKQLILTPQAQRSRRWFLHDLLNYVLPKTDLLLHEMLGLLQRFGADDVVYQMGVIRLLDESQREKEDVLAVAMEETDGAMPLEILRFSSGRLKDVLHAGNISYAVRRLRLQYFPSQDPDEFDELLHHSGGGQHVKDGSPGGAASPARRGGHVEGMPSALRRGPGGDDPTRAAASKVDMIDREIEKLERRMVDDVWGKEQEAEEHDDVESTFADDNDPPVPPPRAVGSSAKRTDGGGSKGAGGSTVLDLVDTLDHRKYLDDEDATAETDRAIAAGRLTTDTQSRLDAFLKMPAPGGKAAKAASSAMGPPPSRSGAAAAAGGIADGPSMDDFDAMYRAVEASYNQM